MSDVLKKVLTEEEYQFVTVRLHGTSTVLLTIPEEQLIENMAVRLASRVAKLEAELEAKHRPPSIGSLIEKHGMTPSDNRMDIDVMTGVRSPDPADVAKVPEGVMGWRENSWFLPILKTPHGIFARQPDGRWLPGCCPFDIGNHVTQYMSPTELAAAYADLLRQMPQAKGESK